MFPLPRFDKRNDRGASLVEYVLLLSLIVILCIGAMTALGGTLFEYTEEVGSVVG